METTEPSGVLGEPCRPSQGVLSPSYCSHCCSPNTCCIPPLLPASDQPHTPGTTGAEAQVFLSTSSASVPLLSARSLGGKAQPCTSPWLSTLLPGPHSSSSPSWPTHSSDTCSLVSTIHMKLSLEAMFPFGYCPIFQLPFRAKSPKQSALSPAPPPKAPVHPL